MTDLIHIPIPAWTERAACASTDPEIFFPDPGGSIRAAKKVCAGCDVRTECLLLALDNENGIGRHSRFGIYGGLTPGQRMKVEMSRRASA